MQPRFKRDVGIISPNWVHQPFETSVEANGFSIAKQEPNNQKLAQKRNDCASLTL